MKNPENPSASHAECNLQEAETETKKAIKDLRHGATQEAKAEIRQAERDLDKAENELKEPHKHSPHKIEITVDGKIKRIEGGIYFVNVFKADVGIPANKEVDIVKDGEFQPLADDAEIKIHAHEIFVSHVRTGASS